MQFDLNFLKNFADNLGEFMGPHCEVVLHNFTGDLDHTIVHIVNGGVSGRDIGGCPTNLFFKNITTLANDKEEFVEYYTSTDDGKTIRSSTTLMTNSDGKLLGAICINMDISKLMGVEDIFCHIIGTKASSRSRIGNEKFSRNVQELMDHYLEEVQREIGKAATEMDKQEKLKALAFLDAKGVFQISKAHIRLCEFFDISKYTLYNYLEEVRKTL